MDGISLLLIVAFLIILHIPTEEVEIIEEKECKPHKWITKPSGIEDNNYLVCEECGYLPDSDAYEEKSRQ